MAIAQNIRIYKIIWLLDRLKILSNFECKNLNNLFKGCERNLDLIQKTQQIAVNIKRPKTRWKELRTARTDFLNK